MSYFASEVETFDLPVLDIGKSVGHTHYIDFIHWDQLSSPVMKGKDIFNRPFLSFKLGILIIENGKMKLSKAVATLFQRYTGFGESLWMFSGCISSCGGVTENQFPMARNLVKGKRVLAGLESGLFVDTFGKQVILAHWGVWEKRACNLIKRNWLNRRYNPRHPLCERVMISNMRSIGALQEDDWD